MALHFCINILDLEHLLQRVGSKELFIVSDDNCKSHCIDSLNHINLINSSPLFSFSPGEENKSLKTFENGIDFLSSNNASRKATLINIGGGITTDLGGFIAATYKRGIPFIHIPTSLMAMVDAAHGSKVGINHNTLKNYIGAFTSPEHIIIYPPFLLTLPTVEILSGFAEVLKHGIIADKPYWDYIKSLQPEALNQEDWHSIIKTSINIKTKIVNEDLLESNIRKTLNYGHTVGHALESHFLKQHKKIPHGHAVAAGMIVEATIAHSINTLSAEDLNDIVTHISALYDKLKFNQSEIQSIVRFMQYDKKNQSHNIEMALPSKIGSCDFNVVVEPSLIEKCLAHYIT